MRGIRDLPGHVAVSVGVAVAAWWAVRVACEIWFWVCPVSSGCQLSAGVYFGALYGVFVIVGVMARLFSPRLAAALVGQVCGFSVAWPQLGGMFQTDEIHVLSEHLTYAWRHVVMWGTLKELALVYLGCGFSTVLGWCVVHGAFRRYASWAEGTEVRDGRPTTGIWTPPVKRKASD